MQPSVELAAILLVAGVAILFLEMFVPSGGLLFVVATLCVVGSILVAFWTSRSVGWTFVAIVSALCVILPGAMLQIWKRSPIGRRMFLAAPGSTSAEESSDEERVTANPDGPFEGDSLIDEIGKTLTPLRPAGKTEIRGRRVDTVAEGVMIDRGEWVRVVDVRGNRVVVRRLEDQEFDAEERSA